MIKMNRISEIARRRNLTVIQDAAHCFEGWCKGQKVGNIGHMTSLPLSPGLSEEDVQYVIGAVKNILS